MKEHPILFSGPMVRAILEGEKTQTRRVIHKPERLDGLMLKGEAAQWCPYGRPGDLLWVRKNGDCFTNYPKEGKGVRGLIEKARARGSVFPPVRSMFGDRRRNCRIL